MTGQNPPVPGAQIPVLRKTRVSVETVKRTTATQVVTESGRKFRLDSGKEIGQVVDRFHGTPEAILPGSPRHARYLVGANIQQADAAAADACFAWERHHRRDPEHIRAAIKALTTLAELIDGAGQQH